MFCILTRPRLSIRVLSWTLPAFRWSKDGEQSNTSASVNRRPADRFSNKDCTAIMKSWTPKERKSDFQHNNRRTKRSFRRKLVRRWPRTGPAISASRLYTATSFRPRIPYIYTAVYRVVSRYQLPITARHGLRYIFVGFDRRRGVPSDSPRLLADKRVGLSRTFWGRTTFRASGRRRRRDFRSDGAALVWIHER